MATLSHFMGEGTAATITLLSPRPLAGEGGQRPGEGAYQWI
ncbi:MAG: hypothetical protein JWL63_142 [Rhodocyclales bacterium]|nr:hypothetical protein [Rhodocyclales bacterium]